MHEDNLKRNIILNLKMKTGIFSSLWLKKTNKQHGRKRMIMGMKSVNVDNNSLWQNLCI